MKKFFTTIMISSFLIFFPIKVSAQSITYTVKSGDSMWKIAVKYQIGLSEIIQANPQIKTPSLIYPGQKLTIPNINDIKAIENEVIRLVNVERQKAGVPALKQNWQLSRIARYKSKDMADKGYFSHTSPTYGSPFKMIESFGIKASAAGENIAYGQPTPKAVMNSWMNSPGHRSNILSSSYSEIGVGVAKNKNGVYYWTQMFIHPSNR
ncbi:SafA/ExsA family spore coat assembly protein [Haloimpatiens sp. FM7330]|uniref:SafA/ExsA family spore coat assembly protein n=1 Tax=Haloimpatiens sp. FM7330 TaxID=3298610 RepID=UPI003631FE0F